MDKRGPHDMGGRRPAPRGNRWRRLLALTALAGAVAGCGLLPKEVEELPPPVEPPQRSVKEIYTVKRGTVVEKVPLRATVVPAREVTLFFRQNGRLRQVAVKAGDTVAAGQLLAELDTGDLETQVELAAINVQKLDLRLQQARERAQKGGADPYDLGILELDRKAAHLQWQLLQQKLAEARLSAPFAGEVTAASGKAGDTVQAFQPVVTLSDPSVLEIRAEVDDATLMKLSPGQKVELTFAELGDTPVEGQLVEVPDPLRDPRPQQGRPRQVKIVPTRPVPGLKKGMTGRGAVVLQVRQDVLVLPNAAIRSFSGRTYVLVLEGNSRREVDVALGVVGETESEIVKGLREGQQVIGK